MAANIDKNVEVRFREYDQDIVIDLSVRLIELVKENVLAQIINKIVEKINLEDLACYYKGTGRPAYHPKMLLKVWLYGYCTRVYTSRLLAKKIREDLAFMWLAAGQRPCFKTLSDFRSCRMKDLLDSIFREVLLYLVEEGYVDLKDLYVDGSKWAANANKHKVVWKKNTERYKAAVLDRIANLLEEAKRLQQEEDEAYGNKDLSTHQKEEEVQQVLNSEELESHLHHLHGIIKQQTDKKRKGNLERIHRQLSKEQEKLDKYEEQQAVLNGRNSYSKTDNDATFFMMKDGRLLPAYNVQITTSNQFIVHASIHQNASDSPTLLPHVKQFEQRLNKIVQGDWAVDYTADAGYGSEENYTFLEDKGHTVYIKYPLWYQEFTGKIEKQPFNAYNWPYDPQQDYYQCPNGKKILFKEEITKTTVNGYERRIRVYESENCTGCSFFKKCRGPRAKPGSKRKVWRSEKLETFKKQVKERLASEEGLNKRSQRSVDVETPFANIKHNMAHRRFVLRGIEKVNIEFHLLAIAHNLKKVYCEQTGIWKEYYAQRAAKSTPKLKKGA